MKYSCKDIVTAILYVTTGESDREFCKGQECRVQG